MGYLKGWYVRVRRAGRVVVRYAGPDRPTALEVAARWSRDEARLRLTDRLRQALLALSKQRVHSLRGPDPVFPGAMTEHEELQAGWRAAFKRAAAQIGQPRLRIHDLRHLCAVNLVRAGLDLPSVQGVLGHTSLLSTMRYAEYSDQTAAVRAARVLDGLRAPRPGASST